MASASLTDVKEELLCPICMDYLTDPVSVDCGHNFCKNCITIYYEKWEDLLEEDLTCPLCKAKIKKVNFRPNWQMANAAEKIKGLSFKTETEAKCGRHNATLNLFCKEDAELVCVYCDRSPEHKLHTTLLLEEAAKEYKGQFGRSLEALEEERKKILAYQAATEEESENLLAQTEAEREKTVVEFMQLHQFLEEEKNRLLAHLKEVEEETARRRDVLLARLFRELSSLDSLIWKVKEKCQQPPSELLKDVGNTLQSCEKRKTVEDPVASLTLNWENQKISDLNSSLKGAIEQFKAALESQLHWQKVPTAKVALDPDTAHPELILSGDRENVREGEERQDLPDSPERFSDKTAVPENEGFTADQDVGMQKPSDVGVARQSVRKKGYFDISSEVGVPAMGKWRSPPLLLSQRLKRFHSDKGDFFNAGGDRGGMLPGSVEDSIRHKSSMPGASPFLFQHSLSSPPNPPTLLSHFTHSTDLPTSGQITRRSSLQSVAAAPKHLVQRASGRGFTTP